MPALFVYLNIFHCSWIVFLHAGHSREDAGLLLLSAGWVLFSAFVRLNVEMQKFQTTSLFGYRIMLQRKLSL